MILCKQLGQVNAHRGKIALWTTFKLGYDHKKCCHRICFSNQDGPSSNSNEVVIPFHLSSSKRQQVWLFARGSSAPPGWWPASSFHMESQSGMSPQTVYWDLITFLTESYMCLQIYHTQGAKSRYLVLSCKAKIQDVTQITLTTHSWQNSYVQNHRSTQEEISCLESGDAIQDISLYFAE